MDFAVKLGGVGRGVKLPAIIYLLYYWRKKTMPRNGNGAGGRLMAGKKLAAYERRFCQDQCQSSFFCVFVFFSFFFSFPALRILRCKMDDTQRRRRGGMQRRKMVVADRENARGQAAVSRAAPGPVSGLS